MVASSSELVHARITSARYYAAPQVALHDVETPEAEAAGHHPDLLVRWGEVTVHLTTHSAGGVTEKDVKLANTIDQI
ncbi:MAG: 4a-hydroxytetrahydrobiopterin dehydratase [Chloroflexi bacterium]|nr:MAG: 4a-hydroxytetrahydrobiopterin dehydratase [Chloroflexota bacterium]